MKIETDAIVVGFRERFTPTGEILPVSIHLLFVPPGKLTIRKLTEYALRNNHKNKVSAMELCDAMKFRLTLEAIE
jgi:coenzyme F420-reducing hydrogenase gamma subunit